MRDPATRSPLRIPGRPANWRGKGLLRILLLVIAAVATVAIASYFGVARDYGYLRATFLTGSPGGNYHALATSLAARAGRGRGSITVVATAGSVENASRLAGERSTATFAFVQDGIPLPADARVEVLGRLPQAEALLLLVRRGHTFATFADLRGASIGMGPEDSGTAYLLLQLLKDPDLIGLDIRLSHHNLNEQIEMIAEGRLDVAAIVMGEDAEFIRSATSKYDLDIASPRELEGLIKRHPWLGLGRIPAGFYDVAGPTPPVDKPVATVDTLVLASLVNLWNTLEIFPSRQIELRSVGEPCLKARRFKSPT